MLIYHQQGSVPISGILLRAISYELLKNQIHEVPNPLSGAQTEPLSQNGDGWMEFENYTFEITEGQMR